MELWEISFKKAIEIQNTKNYEEASYYFVNALSFAPGNLALIKGFITLLSEWSSQFKIDGDDLSAFQQVERSENFIISSVPFVSPEDLPELLSVLKSIRKVKEEFSNETPIEKDPREVEAMKDLDLYKRGKLDTSTQGSFAAIQKNLERLQLVQELISNAIVEDNTTIQSKLEHDINKLQQALQYENLYAEAEKFMSLATSKSNNSSAAMILQHSENLVRQLLTWPEKDDRDERTASLLKTLKEKAEMISDISRKKESEAIWVSFIESQHSNVKKANGWLAPSKDTNDKNCQDQIELLSTIMRALQEVLPKLNHQDIANKAVNLAENLSDLMNKTNISQSKRYNGWVMSKMKDAMKLGDEHTGIIDNEIALCDGMIKIFGEIDTRLLTHEVNRCYSEVFEHLFSHLHKPSDEKDFETKGSKLRLLKKMFECEKISIKGF